MQFNNIVGQANAKKYLLGLVKSNRIAHATMLSGLSGNGALPLAIAYAQYIMCTDRQENDSCGTCPNCTKNNIMQHPDVHYSFPVIKKDSGKVPTSTDFIKQFRTSISQSPYLNITAWLEEIKAENKQANITALECREIIKKLQLRPYEGGFKILIMWLPEYLGKEGNILLKLIEEPPPHTIIILATEQYNKILATIQSRVQLLQLNALTDAEIKNALEKQGTNTQQAIQVARMAMGNYQQALNLLQSTENDYYNAVRDWFNIVFTNNAPAMLQWVQTHNEQGKEHNKMLLQYIITIMSYLVRSKYIGHNNMLLHTYEQELLNKLITKNISEQSAMQIAEMCATAITNIERNVNNKILLHSLCINAKNIFTSKAVYL